MCAILAWSLLFSERLAGEEKKVVVPTDPTERVKAWEQPLEGAWTGRPLREIVEKICGNHQVTIVLDRRIDPGQEIDFSTTGKSTAEEVEELAEVVGMRGSVFGNCAYVGPEHAVRVLQSLIVTRKEELIPRRRSPVGAWMFKEGDFGWKDLEKPREVVERWLKSAEVNVTNGELIPQDRWAGVELKGVTPIEALSVVLIQWDLTFEVDASRNQVTLKPIPEQVAVTREIGVIKAKDKEGRELAFSKLKLLFEEVQFELRGDRVKGTGLWEDLKRAEASLDRIKSVGNIDEEPLKNRKYSLKLRDVPLSQFMKQMRKSGVEFEYDAAEFRKRRINLMTAPTINVENMGSQELFEMLFGPLGLDVELDDKTVRLRVKAQ